MTMEIETGKGENPVHFYASKKFLPESWGATFPDCFQYRISSGLPQWAWTQLCHILGCACISPERVPTSIPWNSVKDCLKEQGPCLRQDAVSSRQTEAYTELICYIAMTGIRDEAKKIWVGKPESYDTVYALQSSCLSFSPILNWIF